MLAGAGAGNHRRPDHDRLHTPGSEGGTIAPGINANSAGTLNVTSMVWIPLADTSSSTASAAARPAAA